MKPVTQQQYITFGVAAIGGGAIAKFVEEQTERKWVGILAAVAFGFMGGLIVDDNDGKQLASYDFTQTPHAYNDAVAGALGGLTGSLTLNIKLFGGRGKSKNGFNGRYNKRKRR